jgi:hypothetical protein
MRFIITLLAMTLFINCQENDPACLKVCNTIDMRVNHENCSCECGYETRWEAVKVNDRFCAAKGSFVALIDSSFGPNLDTFFMLPPQFINQYNPKHKVFFVFQNCLNSSNGGSHKKHDSYYSSYSHGDSLILDWVDAPDCSFVYQSAAINDLWRAPYRLKLNGFLPKGFDSDTMYVKLEYLNWAHKDVHKPAEFVMTKVR